MDKNSTLIVIPARYGSSRFPGKPLADILGHSMLERVCRNVLAAAASMKGASVTIATEDERIMRHAEEIGVRCIMTGTECSSGTERAWRAACLMESRPSLVVNVQGDTPLTPPSAIRSVIDRLRESRSDSVITPVTRLTWAGLRALREHKKHSPFTGTTAAVAGDGRALWFSKNIIPAIRSEGRNNPPDAPSPVLRHIGIYGYPTGVLEKFVGLPQGNYERLEGLEQLRMLENDIAIQTVEVSVGDTKTFMAVDTQADLEPVCEWLRVHGDPLH